MARAQVCWIFASEDDAIANELLSRAAVLEAQGLVENWELITSTVQRWREHDLWISPSRYMRRRPGPGVTVNLRSADMAVFLCSPALFAGATWRTALSIITEKQHARVIPVVVSAMTLPPDLASFQALPRNGNAILAQPSREDALLEVIQSILETIKFRAVEAPLAARSPGVISPGGAPIGTTIHEIFRLNGPPTFTFIEPPEFARLQLELRTMGTGLIVEGPSKVGKSTAIRKAMDAIGAPGADQIWLHGQRLPPLEELRTLLDNLLRSTRSTWLFIEDFHHLDDARYRRELASAMKVLADLPTGRAKVTLIGINPLGNSLVQVMPDLAGRFRVIRLDVEKDWAGSSKIAELIIRGEVAANIRFKRRDELVTAAAGSFFLAQYLCNVAAVKAGVVATGPELAEVELGPNDVIAAIQGELAARFRAPIIELAAFDEAPPPRGAGLSLLWLLSRSGDGFVAVREARLRFPMLDAAFDWFLASNLARCFREHPALQGLLYYNAVTQTLTMEDPQLKFYLRALDWEELARASGHGQVRFHPEDGPLWTSTGTLVARGGGSTVTATGAVGEVAGKVTRRVLHLSDLHFATKDQATIWYSQLAADLREQQIDRLDALVVSGDLGNGADATEYDAARLFLGTLMSGFSLTARQVALVPGNHDVSYPLGEDAYRPYRRSRYTGTLTPGAYIEHEGGLIEVREDEPYRQRFQPFAELYRAIKGVSYPLAYEDQGIIEDLSGLGLCILGLNSAWQIDKYFADRASIHPEALANALLKLGAAPAGQLRIAVFHHPLHGGEDAQLRDASFLQQLAVHGFRLALHGHVHKADAELYRYDRSEGGRRIEIVAAGTFGAPTRAWVPGYPLEYNLLLIDADRITVETRCRREINGAWEPDARWRQGPGKDPVPRHVIAR